MKKGCREPTARLKTGCDEWPAGARIHRGEASKGSSGHSRSGACCHQSEAWSPERFRGYSANAIERLRMPRQISGAAILPASKPGTSVSRRSLGLHCRRERVGLFGFWAQIALQADAVMHMVAREFRSLRAPKLVGA